MKIIFEKDFSINAREKYPNAKSIVSLQNGYLIFIEKRV